MIPRSITLLFWHNGHSFGRRTHYLVTQKSSENTQLGKEMQVLKAKLTVCEYEYNAIRNCWRELERDKDLLNRYQIYEEKQEDRYQRMDYSEIPRVTPEIHNTGNPQKMKSTKS